MKAVKAIKDVGEVKQDESCSNEDNLIVNGIFRCILSFINTFFNYMTAIFSSSPGILWGIIFLIAFQIAMSHAAPTSTNDVSTQTSITTKLSSQGPSSTFTLYNMDTMESRTHTFQMDEIRHEGFSGLATSHSAIPTPHEICLAHPASFQSTQMSIDNFEKAIVKHTHSLHSVKRECKLPPDYYSSLDINATLAVKPGDRNAFEKRAVTQHSLRMEENPHPQNQV